MNSSSDSSPLHKSVSRGQIIGVITGVLLLIIAVYGSLLLRSRQPQSARAPAGEMSTINRDIESDRPIVAVTEAPPGSHQDQVKAEILNNLRSTAQNGR